jgi:Phosphoenolpyruvate phosphomutase
MPTIGERRQIFRELHRDGCFAIPNPWDIGSVRYLQHLGFSAIATTSAGYAFSRGLPDSGVGRDACSFRLPVIKFPISSCVACRCRLPILYRGGQPR